MVTKRTGNPHGTPPIAWADDPDRYAVALIAALDAFEATSTRQASLLAAVLMLGKYVVDIPLSVLHPGLVGGTYEKLLDQAKVLRRSTGAQPPCGRSIEPPCVIPRRRNGLS